MNSEAGLGTVLVVLGGLLQGSFAFPLNRIQKWRWENTWLVYSVVGLLIFPLGLALATVPHLAGAYRNVPVSALAAVAVFGFGWGLGSTLFGLGISRIGIALGFAIILGITSSLGSLLPLLITNPMALWTRRGAFLIVGLALVIAGIIACSVAGSMRERQQKPSGAGSPTNSFGSGLLICVVSGVLSPMLNFSFVFGSGVRDAAIAAGAGQNLAANAIWVPALAAGFLPNAGYAVYLLSRNAGWSLFVAPSVPKAYWLGAVFMGLFWYGGVSTYGLGAAAMGDLGAVVGWPVFMSMVIVTANVLGALSGEWRNAGRRALVTSWIGIAILVAAIAVISRGT
jgi:L-rhamnose-H+ transport protein